MESSKAVADRIKFKNPPINELVIALYHLPIIELKAQHIGLYWDRIRGRYPECAQQQLVIPNPSDPQPFSEVPGEIFPLPRFWFSNPANPLLIQIQRNAFILNWRRNITNEYPHYETVMTNFRKEFDNYKNFVRELEGTGLDVVQRCELTYVNMILADESGTSLEQLMNILPSIAGLKDIQTDNRKMVGLNAAVTYRVDQTLLINMTAKTGRHGNSQELIAVIELKAHGVPNDLSLEGTRSWYDSAHEAIYNMFLDATNKEVQKTLWNPQ